MRAPPLLFFFSLFPKNDNWTSRRRMTTMDVQLCIPTDHSHTEFPPMTLLSLMTFRIMWSGRQHSITVTYTRIWDYFSCMLILRIVISSRLRIDLRNLKTHVFQFPSQNNFISLSRDHARVVFFFTTPCVFQKKP